MSKLSKPQIINAFSRLGEYLINPHEELMEIINSEKHYNAWFTPANVNRAVKAIAELLTPAYLEEWLNSYSIPTSSPKKVGLILAGNIPSVGFHDVLCVLITGNYALIKASSQDARLIRHVLNMLVAIEPDFQDKFSIVESFHGRLTLGFAASNISKADMSNSSVATSRDLPCSNPASAPPRTSSWINL